MGSWAVLRLTMYLFTLKFPRQVHKGLVCGIMHLELFCIYFGTIFFFHSSNQNQGEMFPHVNIAKYKFVFKK